MRGELDWIVMKALEKDRTRRYRNGHGFARDVQRYLSDEAVEARPPSAGYRFRKFASRNKATIASGAVDRDSPDDWLGRFYWLATRATQAETQAQANLTQLAGSEIRAETTRSSGTQPQGGRRGSPSRQ